MSFKMITIPGSFMNEDRGLWLRDCIQYRYKIKKVIQFAAG